MRVALLHHLLTLVTYPSICLQKVAVTKRCKRVLTVMLLQLRSLIDEDFYPLASYHGYRQPSGLRKATRPLFWRLEVYHYTSLLSSTRKPWHVYKPSMIGSPFLHSPGSIGLINLDDNIKVSFTCTAASPSAHVESRCDKLICECAYCSVLTSTIS